jgi:hypothetical protein
MNNERHNIKEEDVSIVMQGAILDTAGKLDSDFLSNLDHVIRYFGYSEIIVSTWKLNEEISIDLKMKYPQVKFIFSDDIGSIAKSIDGVKVVSNINRMVISTWEGLKVATRKYAIKIRTDSHFFSNQLLSIFNKVYMTKDIFPNKIEEREEEFSILKKRVINCNLFARSPHSHLPFLFHPGDILFAGELEDLKSLFDIPLADDSIIATCKSLMNTCYMRLVPEQYLWIRCIEKHTGIAEIESNFQRNKTLVQRSERYYLNNFIPFHSDELGFEWCKHKAAYHRKGLSSVYLFEDWMNLYRKYLLLERSRLSLALLFRDFKVILMKVYFFFRTRLLDIALIRKLAFKLFVKRGN